MRFRKTVLPFLSRVIRGLVGHFWRMVGHFSEFVGHFRRMVGHFGDFVGRPITTDFYVTRPTLRITTDSGSLRGTSWHAPLGSDTSEEFVDTFREW